jgi:predicted tellurium resistance membrane protein TerC
MEWIAHPEAWVALATLAVLEIVLGIDNIIFISILADKLPRERQARARQLGLLLAMVTRLALLGTINMIMRLTAPLFSLMGHAYSGRDLILVVGGLFLLTKSTREIHHRLEGDDDHAGKVGAASYGAVLVQIAIMDMVFSLDSVITAVGLAEDFAVMAIAIVLAVVVMLLAANAVSRFVNNHPTVKMLALSFLLLLGMQFQHCSGDLLRLSAVDQTLFAEHDQRGFVGLSHVTEEIRALSAAPPCEGALPTPQNGDQRIGERMGG